MISALKSSALKSFLALRTTAAENQVVPSRGLLDLKKEIKTMLMGSWRKVESRSKSAGTPRQKDA